MAVTGKAGIRTEPSAVRSSAPSEPRLTMIRSALTPASWSVVSSPSLGVMIPASATVAASNPDAGAGFRIVVAPRFPAAPRAAATTAVGIS